METHRAWGERISVAYYLEANSDGQTRTNVGKYPDPGPLSYRAKFRKAGKIGPILQTLQSEEKVTQAFCLFAWTKKTG
ncbi:MAG: hypothetical protein VYC82_04110 [Verrucomicrobiota bacterium]|nr:hypothetical protein [Verrucomicrobiota bacterium]